MSSPPSNIHYPITKQHRKPSFRNNPAPSKVNCKIKPSLIWHFDSPRKDAKRQARLRGIKFFYSLEVKLCNKDYHYLRCLKSDKPCCRYLIMKLDKPCLYTYDFPVRKHHIKLFKIEIGSKAHIDLTTKFWKRISPQITVFDYISNEIANFRQIITTSPAYQYRMLNNFGFPIVRNMSDLYQTVFNFVKNLRALKMLSFNTVSQINAVDASSILTSLNWLSHLRGLNLTFKGNNAICVDTISQALQNFQKLQFLSLQFGKITTRNNQELLLQKATMLTERLYAIRHLELEVYLENRYKEAFCLFLSGLENLKALISLDLKIDRGSSSFAESLDLPDVEESVLSRIKDLSLEGNKYGIGIDLAEYFLNKTKNLRACFLKNIELERSKKSSQNLAEVVLANENLKEFKVLYEDAFDAEALETLFHGIKKLKNLQMFSVQLQSLEPIEFKLDDLISAILDLKKADTIVIEILYPIKINLTILNKLFDNIFKLKRLSALKLDLRLLNELKGSGVRKLFMLESLDILTVIIEGMKLTKEDQRFVKEHSKTMKRLNTCLLECEDFKVDRIF